MNRFLNWVGLWIELIVTLIGILTYDFWFLDWDYRYHKYLIKKGWKL